MLKSQSIKSNCPTCRVRSLSIFADKDYSTPCELLNNKEELSFKKGEKIIQAGDAFEGFFCIKSGTVKIYKPLGGKKEFILWFAQAGESIGIDAFFNNENCQYSASAIRDVKLCFISTPKIEELIKNNSKTYLRLMEYFCKRIDFIEKRITSIAQKKTKAHLAELLATLGREDVTSQKEINLEYSMKDIANIIGTTQNYLYKISSELIQAKIIKLKNKKLQILDQVSLTKLATGTK